MFPLLKKKDLNAFYVDTNFLYGEVKILAKEGLTGLQHNKKLELLRNFKIIILMSDLNEYEIRRRLMQDFRKTFSEAKNLYIELMSILPVTQLQIKDLRLTPAVINRMLQHKLGFRDGLHILIAERAQVPLVTNERQAQEWKNTYERVYTLEEFWNKIKNG